jgi:hypothetical protein
MTARGIVLCGLLLPSAALAQLQLYLVVQGGGEQAINGLLNVGTSPTGDILDTRLRIRNTGSTSETLRRLRIEGAGFSLEGYPSLPYIVAPGTNVDFRVRFRPTGYGSYSADLRVNDSITPVLGSSPATAALSVEEDGQFRPLSAGVSVIFGAVEQGTNVTRRFKLENPTTVAVSVTTLAVEGASFQMTAGITTPLNLKPGESAAFEVTFAPQKTGLHFGTLRVDQRSFSLEAFVLDPPFPALEIVFESPVFESGRQGKISVRLAAPSPASGTGDLRIEFHPSGTLGDDPAIQFLANSGRSLPFTVENGSDATVFAGQSEAIFQTGTTAGEIVFTAQLGRQKQQASLIINPAAIAIESTRTARTPTGVEVQIIGFDNTRSASQLAFTFYSTSGQVVGAGPIRVDAAEPFSHYFLSSQVGGVFSLRAVFPVAGSPAEIGSVEVEMTNSAGSTRSQRLTF